MDMNHCPVECLVVGGVSLRKNHNLEITLPGIVNKSKRRSSLRENNKLRQRCTVLIEIAKSLGILYRDVNAPTTQKHYIETILGAALWYLPTSRELWTGDISLQALRDFHPDSGIAKPKLTEDHVFPRKVSAVELMKRSWDDQDQPEMMLELYLKRYGLYNYVTPLENKRLVKYQKTHVFKAPADSYQLANVRLIRISLSDLELVKKRNGKAIEACINAQNNKAF